MSTPSECDSRACDLFLSLHIHQIIALGYSKINSTIAQPIEFSWCRLCCFMHTILIYLQSHRNRILPNAVLLVTKSRCNLKLAIWCLCFTFFSLKIYIIDLLIWCYCCCCYCRGETNAFCTFCRRCVTLSIQKSIEIRVHRSVWIRMQSECLLQIFI